MGRGGQLTLLLSGAGHVINSQLSSRAVSSQACGSGSGSGSIAWRWAAAPTVAPLEAGPDQTADTLTWLERGGWVGWREGDGESVRVDGGMERV